MSDFSQQTINPKTGKAELAEWLDDHFGRHVYGVRFASGEVYCENEVVIAGEQVNQLGPKALDSDASE